MVCSICPRKCGVDREFELGYCCSGERIKIARAALHYWEEPCISGVNGSGTIFFCGCSLGCIFCQNKAISRGEGGLEVTEDRLIDIMFELKEKGANNINLVTPDHYAPVIRKCLISAKKRGLDLPIVMNTGGYMSYATYSLLKDVTDIWLTDYKFYSSSVAMKYANAADYPDIAYETLCKMVEDTGEPSLDGDLMKKGVIVRVLLLPGNLKDAKNIVKLLYNSFGDKIVLSLMNQYTPPSIPIEEYPELNRKVSKKDYERLLDYAIKLGIDNAFIQEGDTAKESFIPLFDNTGVLK